MGLAESVGESSKSLIECCQSFWVGLVESVGGAGIALELPLTCKVIFTFSPQAFQRGLRYPQYMFLTYAWYTPGWWKRQPAAENLSCSSDDRASVLPRTLAFIHADVEENFDLEPLTDTGIVS